MPVTYHDVCFGLKSFGCHDAAGWHHVSAVLSRNILDLCYEPKIEIQTTKWWKWPVVTTSTFNKFTLVITFHQQARFVSLSCTSITKQAFNSLKPVCLFVILAPWVCAGLGNIDCFCCLHSRDDFCCELSRLKPFDYHRVCLFFATWFNWSLASCSFHSFLF